MRTFAGLSVFLVSCAATPGAKPHDMSQAHHEAAAREQEQLAESHQAEFDPAKTVEHEHCTPAIAARRDPSYPNNLICWTSVTNPTAKHEREARDHRKQAADHRAASAALRDAEERSCGGIAPDDRDISPFEHLEDLVSVEPLDHLARRAGRRLSRVDGVRIVLRAVPGLTEQWLQRVIDCHLARNSSLGHEVPEMVDCPLVPRGVEATVRAVHGGFAVELRAGDEETANEILKRARRLLEMRDAASGVATIDR
jgi:hypothetical protein